MRKRGERSMLSDFGAVGPILLGVAALAILAFSGYRIFRSRAEQPKQKYPEQKNQCPTEKDRELLELVGDLAELYRATGR